LRSRLLCWGQWTRFQNKIEFLCRLNNWQPNRLLCKAQWQLYVVPDLTSRNITFCPQSVFTVSSWISPAHIFQKKFVPKSGVCQLICIKVNSCHI
jgi:hypothetical protein